MQSVVQWSDGGIDLDIRGKRRAHFIYSKSTCLSHQRIRLRSDVGQSFVISDLMYVSSIRDLDSNSGQMLGLPCHLICQHAVRNSWLDTRGALLMQLFRCHP